MESEEPDADAKIPDESIPGVSDNAEAENVVGSSTDGYSDGEKDHAAHGTAVIDAAEPEEENPASSDTFEKNTEEYEKDGITPVLIPDKPSILAL